MIATTRKQSERLMKCGISADTADMAYIYYDDEGQVSHDDYKEVLNYEEADGYVELVPKKFNDYDRSLGNPAWSLSALFALLPKEMDAFECTCQYDNYGDEGLFITDIAKYILDGELKITHNGKNFIVDYDWDGFLGFPPQAEDPIEACVLAIELLHANGYKFDQVK